MIGFGEAEIPTFGSYFGPGPNFPNSDDPLAPFKIYRFTATDECAKATETQRLAAMMAAADALVPPAQYSTSSSASAQASSS